MLIKGYIARETEAAVAFVRTAETQKPLWLPRKKIASLTELDAVSIRVQLAGEKIARLAVPVEIDIDEAFLAKIPQ